jgi:hypothetical protein
MNSRIQELAQQATQDILGVPTLDQQKFAELIVRDCVLISRTSTDGFSAGRRMEQHFGVEE